MTEITNSNVLNDKQNNVSDTPQFGRISHTPEFGSLSSNLNSQMSNCSSDYIKDILKVDNIKNVNQENDCFMANRNSKPPSSEISNNIHKNEITNNVSSNRVRSSSLPNAENISFENSVEDNKSSIENVENQDRIYSEIQLNNNNKDISANSSDVSANHRLWYDRGRSNYYICNLNNCKII